MVCISTQPRRHAEVWVDTSAFSKVALGYLNHIIYNPENCNTNTYHSSSRISHMLFISELGLTHVYIDI